MFCETPPRQPFTLLHIPSLGIGVPFFMNLLHEDALLVQKRASSLLKLELQVVLSHPVWVLGTKLRSSGRAGSLAPGAALELLAYVLFFSWSEIFSISSVPSNFEFLLFFLCSLFHTISILWAGFQVSFYWLSRWGSVLFVYPFVAVCRVPPGLL